MKKTLFFVFGIALAFGLGVSAPSAHALSCLPVDMYLESVLKEEGGETLVFAGTATEVTANHTQVVTVTEPLKGWVAPKVWVQHPYSNDWQYFCSNGPAKAGEPTVFLVSVNEFGSFNVNQTLDADSQIAKDFMKDLKDADIDAGITQATPGERSAEVVESIKSILSALINLLGEMSYWQTQK